MKISMDKPDNTTWDAYKAMYKGGKHINAKTTRAVKLDDGHVSGFSIKVQRSGLITLQGKDVRYVGSEHTGKIFELGDVTNTDEYIQAEFTRAVNLYESLGRII